LRGIGVVHDELKGWIANFNRYNPGNEEQFWLSAFSRQPIKVTRKTTGTKLVKKPFLNVIGSIQPSVLKEISKGRILNGFFDRILFVYPENIKKKPISDTEVSIETMEQLGAILDSFLNLHYDQENPFVLTISDEAMKVFKGYNTFNSDQINKECEEVAGIKSKMEIYTIRFALLLELLFWVCGESSKKEITEKSMKGALILSAYFEKEAIKISELVHDLDPISELPKNKQDWYNSLPEEFETAHAVFIGNELAIKKRTVYTDLRNQNLFEKITHGNYRKIC
jgi:hypothetical protein